MTRIEPVLTQVERQRRIELLLYKAKWNLAWGIFFSGVAVGVALGTVLALVFK